MHKFKDIFSWQKSITLAEEIYKVTSKFPGDEKYGLRVQMNRSAVSIPSNIAEGAGRESDKEFCYFLSISLGSAYELETQIILASRMQFISEDSKRYLLSLIYQVQRLIIGLRKEKSRTSNNKSNTFVTIALFVLLSGLCAFFISQI